MPTPRVPARETRDKLLAILGEYVAKAGAAGGGAAVDASTGGGGRSFLLPCVEPGDAAFPEPWAPTKSGVELLLRRLAWHAGIEREIEIDDRRAAAAPPTERKPATRVELVDVRGKRARFELGFIGGDAIVGTLAHEIGTLYAVLHPPDASQPYRTAEAPVVTVDHERDGERGAVAAVFLGLGVLAANAAYQQYSYSGRFNGAYEPLEYEVIQAGALPMSALAYLLAVQAIVRGESAPPRGLQPPQRDEVDGWMKALASEREELCERLGIAPSDADAVARLSRPVPVAFAERELAPEEAAPKNAFRWQTNRGGIGFVAGTVLGMGLAFVVSRGLLPIVAFGGATAGHVIGRRVRTPRCSACATVVRPAAGRCATCGAVLRGDIASLADRLDAEERLDGTAESDPDAHT